MFKVILAATLSGLLLLAASSAAPQFLRSSGGTILVPINSLAQTQIQGVPYIILPANGAGQQRPFTAPSRFFFRTVAPVDQQQQQQQQQQFVQQAPAEPQQIESQQQQQQQAQFQRIDDQPEAAPVTQQVAPAPPAAAPQQPSVLVRQEVIEPGKRVAVFRKPVDVAPLRSDSEIKAPPQPYSYSYSINGEDTGDVKTASETFDGNVVKGSYSVVEPDGTLRVVHYQADALHGFTAQVERTAGAYPAIPDPPRHRPESVQDNQQQVN